MKVCNKCKVEKEYSEFDKCKQKKDGLQYTCKLCRKEYFKNNKEIISVKQKAHYETNKEIISVRHNVYRLKNKDKFKKYYQANKKSINKYRNEWAKTKRKTDALFSLKSRCRCLINLSFIKKEYKKSSRTHELLGCDWITLKEHIENQFTIGMSWDNRSEWHIDHIIPLAIAATKDEVEILSYYKNLQPLWAEDNLRKSGSFE